MFENLLVIICYGAILRKYLFQMIAEKGTFIGIADTCCLHADITVKNMIQRLLLRAIYPECIIAAQLPQPCKKHLCLHCIYRTVMVCCHDEGCWEILRNIRKRIDAFDFLPASMML